jgi:hypothetical protein
MEDIPLRDQICRSSSCNIEKIRDYRGVKYCLLCRTCNDVIIICERCNKKEDIDGAYISSVLISGHSSDKKYKKEALCKECRPNDL